MNLGEEFTRLQTTVIKIVDSNHKSLDTRVLKEIE
jgi:hypothetical protein